MSFGQDDRAQSQPFQMQAPGAHGSGSGSRGQGKAPLSGTQRRKSQLGSLPICILEGPQARGSRDLDLNRKALERQKVRLQQQKLVQLQRHKTEAPEAPPQRLPDQATLVDSLVNASVEPLQQDQRSQLGAGHPDLKAGPAGSPRTITGRSSAAVQRAVQHSAGSDVSCASSGGCDHSNLPQSPALAAARAASGEVQPSSFSSPSEVAEVRGSDGVGGGHEALVRLQRGTGSRLGRRPRRLLSACARTARLQTD